LREVSNVITESELQEKVAEIVLELDCTNWQEHSKEIAKKIIKIVRHYDSTRYKDSNR